MGIGGVYGVCVRLRILMGSIWGLGLIRVMDLDINGEDGVGI